MSIIQLTSDGYSFHTLELKIHPKFKDYQRILKQFYQRSTGSCKGTTYPLLKYRTKWREPHCSTLLSEHGILLYFTSTKLSRKTASTAESGSETLIQATIKAVINPRKVLDSKSSFLGIMPSDEGSFENFQDCFTDLMRKYDLPEFLDEWTLSRLDLCVNIQFDKKKSAREINRLLHKDLFPPRVEQIFFFKKNSDAETQAAQKDKDRYTLKLQNDSYALVVYDKLYQMEAVGLSPNESQLKLPKGILRVELHCLAPFLGKLTKKEKLKSTSAQIRYLTVHSRFLLTKYVGKTFSWGEHYKPDTARKIIQASGYQNSTRKQLLWLLNRMRRLFSVQMLEHGMDKNFNVKRRTVERRLEQLQKLGINPVPLRTDFYLNKLPSIPLILKTLEDDSCFVTIDNAGQVSY